ncbi:glycine oxidase ThiO [Geitlerinema sp. CS-897]|nr:glycine oxidase ThiO [Geitlerinema sp. CS-897]
MTRHQISTETTPDILVIGGGVIGLAVALELRLRGATVTVVSRDFQQAASHAAGGMIAPQAEEIPPGAMLQLCLRSREMFAEWSRQLSELSGLSAGYWACGILAPFYEMPKTQPPKEAGTAVWLDRETVRQHQPGLGEDVVGGWWYPEDAQADSRALARSLSLAVRKAGVTVREGVNVEALIQQGDRIVGVQTNEGRLQAGRYAIASGSWANELLPIPVFPVKGQMFSVRTPHNTENLPLRRVLFGPETYIIPRRNGEIVVGATTEGGGFTPGNTPEGMRDLLARAVRLYPALKHYAIEEFWWGFRPGTPDELPILGSSYCDNLVLATGHYRNGILLAPITAKLTADLLWDGTADPLLESFRWDRFQAIESTASETPAAAVHHRNGNGHTVPSSSYTTLSVRETSTTSLPTSPQLALEDTPLTIAGRTFRSRLMTGSGKYRHFDDMRRSIALSGCEIVTVAVRRVQTNAPGHEGLAEALDWSKIWMLPNTAGCKTSEEAVRVARLGREMAKLLGQEDNNFVKLEVIPDPTYLLPDPVGTLQAAEQLVKEGFAVLPYINADPMLAKRLEDVGCATVMPLGSPIGSGQGIQTAANVRVIVENAKIPVVVDAGIGTPSEAAQAMELGADAVLINSAIAMAKNPPAMAQAMGLAVTAGRLAYRAGRIPIKALASASSPLTGTIE